MVRWKMSETVVQKADDMFQRLNLIRDEQAKGMNLNSEEYTLYQLAFDSGVIAALNEIRGFKRWNERNH
jgi:hypothetical protein